MSITLPSITQPASGRRSGWLVRICFGRVPDILAHRDAIEKVSELTDGEFRDIGLRRCQIEDAVRGILTVPTGEALRSASSRRRAGLQALTTQFRPASFAR